jgi:hypothetical protein
VEQPTGRVEFAISKGNPASGLTALDLMEHDPALRRCLEGTAVELLIAEAEDEVRDLITARGVPVYDLWGGEEMKRPVKYMALFLAAEQYGYAYQGTRQELWDRAKQCIEILASVASVDRDRDSKIDGTEQQGGLPRGIRLSRSG